MHFSNSHTFQINLLISIKFFKLNKKKILLSDSLLTLVLELELVFRIARGCSSFGFQAGTVML